MHYIHTDVMYDALYSYWCRGSSVDSYFWNFASQWFCTVDLILDATPFFYIYIYFFLFFFLECFCCDGHHYGLDIRFVCTLQHWIVSQIFQDGLFTGIHNWTLNTICTHKEYWFRNAHSQHFETTSRACNQPEKWMKGRWGWLVRLLEKELEGVKRWPFGFWQERDLPAEPRELSGRVHQGVDRQHHHHPLQQPHVPHRWHRVE